MKKSGQCPKCDSTNVLRDVKAIDFGDGLVKHELSIGVDRNPNAILFRDQQRSSLSAWVCADCGYVEFYADDVSSLVKAIQVANARRNV